MRLAWLFVVTACHHGASGTSGASGAAPPAAPGCAAAADHVRGLLGPEDRRAARVRDAFATRCAADGWNDDARACIVATTSLARPRHCKARLTAAQRAALDRDLDAVRAAPPSPIPSVCRDYGEMVDKLAACPALPEAATDALEHGYRDLLRGWMRGTYDARMLETQCRAMVDGLRRGLAARCGG